MQKSEMFVRMDFRDNPKLGDGNLVKRGRTLALKRISEITPN